MSIEVIFTIGEIRHYTYCSRLTCCIRISIAGCINFENARTAGSNISAAENNQQHIRSQFVLGGGF